MPKTIDDTDLNNLNAPFKKSMFLITGVFGFYLCVHQLIRLRMSHIMRRTYQSYAGNVLDVYPRRLMHDIDLIPEYRFQKGGQKVSTKKIAPLNEIQIVDDKSNPIREFIENHPKFVYNEIPLKLHVGPQIDARGANSEIPTDPYVLPVESNSVQTVSCLFGFSKTTRDHQAILHEFYRVCAPCGPDVVSSRIILLDWGPMQNSQLRKLQMRILQLANSDIKSLPNLVKIAEENNCVVVGMRKYFFGAIVLVAAQPMK